MPILAWQGWRLDLPARWNPVKLEGDRDRGYALFADLHRPRLEVRWDRPRMKRFDAEAWSRKALRGEVGKGVSDEQFKPLPLAREEWTASLLYQPHELPGRDVWVGYSEATGRVVQVAHHVRHRDRMLVDAILPTLQDTPGDEPSAWAVFELSCVTPAGWRLESQRLMAGDLSLTFARDRSRVTVRQVAVAQLALQRMPLDRWLRSHQSARKKHYRTAAEQAPATLEAVGGRSLSGLRGTARRRRRYFWMRQLPRSFVGYALHDRARDRLVLVDGDDEKVVEGVAASVGWAQA